MKYTKIVCTIGPASEKTSILTKMVKAGMNVARLNFSHGTHANHRLLMQNVRAVSKTLKQPIAIIQDLQGPKIRVGARKEPITVKAGQIVTIGKDFTIDYPIASSVKAGERILIQDGLIELVVTKVAGGLITCEVKNGGVIREHKGVNLPDSTVKFPIITDKDKKDLLFGLKNDVDYVALSFVRGKKDVQNLQKLIKKHTPKKQTLPKVISKIERKEAIEKIDEIIAVSDCIMVARGDMGVELNDAEVPIIQKNIIQKCLEAGKPVIVATQMLESMVENPRPTRAEVSDVANAVIDHTDCVMLSEESAFGKYPLNAVTEMAKVIEVTEHSRYAGPSCDFYGSRGDAKVAALAKTACELAINNNTKAIIGVTDSGLTARMLSRSRPNIPMYILTDNEKLCRQLTLLRGVFPILTKRFTTATDVLDLGLKEVKKRKLIKKGDNVIMVVGRPIGGKANLLEAITL